MDNTNSKIITLCFAVTAALIGLTVKLLLVAFSSAFGIVARASSSDLVKHGLPVVLGLAVFAALQFNPRVLAWADEVVLEIKKVVFPSRKDTSAMTMVVIIMVFISSIVIASFDFISGYVLNILMR